MNRYKTCALIGCRGVPRPLASLYVSARWISPRQTGPMGYQSLTDIHYKL